MPDAPAGDSSVWFEIVVVLLLVFLNGFFAMSELAIVSARRARLKPLADGGNRGARRALALADEPTAFLATVQIGITLVGIVAGAYSGATLSEPLAAVFARWGLPADYAYPAALTLVVASITYLSLVIGELVPKRIAMNHAEAIAMRVSLPMSMLARIGTPIVFVLRFSTNTLLALIGLGQARDTQVTEDEIKSMIAEGTETGIFVAAERHMIEGVLHLADYSIRSIMTPRTEIDWIDVEDSADAIRKRVLGSMRSRLLVCQQRVDDVLGVVETKELLRQLAEGGVMSPRSCMKPALALHETTSILRLLEMFRQAPAHLAVVLDEYGGVEGIVTPTDIFAVIAGELAEPDETDDGIAPRGEGSWLIDGRTRLIDVERQINAAGFIHPDYSTLAGLLLHQLGHLPKAGESIVYNGFRMEVIDLDGRRIDKILVDRLAEPIRDQNDDG